MNVVRAHVVILLVALVALGFTLLGTDMIDWINTHRSTAIGALAGVLAIIAAFVAESEQDSATAEQNRLLQKLNEKNEKLAAKDDQIIALQERHLDQLTGGDSICRMTFKNSRDGVPTAGYEVIGEYPLTGVHISVLNLTLNRTLENMPSDDRFEKAAFAQPVGTISPRSSFVTRRFRFPEIGTTANYFVSIQQVNGAVCQIVRVKRNDDGSILTASRIFRESDRGAFYKEIKELRNVDRGFPLDETGKVPWIDYPGEWQLAIDLVE